jgi:hypothetical protein
MDLTHMTDTYEDGFNRGFEFATLYLRCLAKCFLARDDVPESVADVPAFLMRIAKNIDDAGAGFAGARAEQNAPQQGGDSVH